MTTAARPTWAPAKGGNEQGGTRIFGPSQKYSSRDLAAHTTLKLRKDGQDTQEELQKRNLHEELEDREHRHFSSKDKYLDEEIAGKVASSFWKREVEEHIIPHIVDADDDSDVEEKSKDESNSSEDYDDEDEDEDEDETMALLEELERLKKERAEEKLGKEKLEKEEELRAKEAELLRGNPLLNNPTTFNVKRRWDDDVVFKKQAPGETKALKRFINDTIRNDFRCKFLQKYMK